MRLACVRGLIPVLAGYWVQLCGVFWLRPCPQRPPEMQIHRRPGGCQMKIPHRQRAMHSISLDLVYLFGVCGFHAIYSHRLRRTLLLTHQRTNPQPTRTLISGRSERQVPNAWQQYSSTLGSGQQTAIHCAGSLQKLYCQRWARRAHSCSIVLATGGKFLACGFFLSPEANVCASNCLLMAALHLRGLPQTLLNGGANTEERNDAGLRPVDVAKLLLKNPKDDADKEKLEAIIAMLESAAQHFTNYEPPGGFAEDGVVGGSGQTSIQNSGHKVRVLAVCCSYRYWFQGASVQCLLIMLKCANFELLIRVCELLFSCIMAGFQF